MTRPTKSKKKTRKHPAKKGPVTVASAHDLMFEGPGDLSTHPKHMEGFGQPNKPVRAAGQRRAGEERKRPPEGGRLFLSFWHIALDNLPVGSFRHRRLAADEARQCVAQAQKDGLLACCSEDDLLAPYGKDKRKDHEAMCKVLGKHYGISVTLRDFTTSPDERGSYMTFPLEFARISETNRLLVVTCMYMLPERRKSGSARRWLDMEIDPDSVKFHLFESIGKPGEVRAVTTRQAGKKSLAQLFADSPLKGLDLPCDRD